MVNKAKKKKESQKLNIPKDMFYGWHGKANVKKEGDKAIKSIGNQRVSGQIIKLYLIYNYKINFFLLKLLCNLSLHNKV